MRYLDKSVCVPIHVVKGGGPNLLGRDLLTQFHFNLSDLNMFEGCSQPLKAVLDKHPDVFSDQVGCLRDVAVTLPVHSDAKPKFYKPRPVPLLLKKKVEEELTSLEEQGIISPVQFSSWAAPVVPVVKKSGKVRLCGDYKLTINQVSPTDTYPLPRVDELYANLAGGKYFSKLDMSNAYLQLPLDEEQEICYDKHT